MQTLNRFDLQEIKANIENGIEEWSIKTYPAEHRNHLGISEIGDKCSRKLWYKFHWADLEIHDGRMRRLFARGHREEEKYINYLEGIGCTVHRFDTNGKQFRMTSVMGHYGGSCDGVVITPWHSGVPFLAEFKTHNTKSFTYYVQHGLKKAKPQHWAQMCSYGYKLNIQYGIYFPENKNDDDIQVEIVELDWNYAKQLEKKAEEIILSPNPPERISNNPAYQECQWCFLKNVCHNNKIPLKNCRSCKNSMPTENGTWTCSKFGVIPESFIKSGCNEWIPL